MFVIIFIICLLNVQDDNNRGIIFHLGMALFGTIYFYFIFYSIAILSMLVLILLSNFLGISSGNSAEGGLWEYLILIGGLFGFIVAFRETMKKLKGKNNNDNNNASNTNTDNSLSNNSNADPNNTQSNDNN